MAQKVIDKKAFKKPIKHQDDVSTNVRDTDQFEESLSASSLAIAAVAGATLLLEACGGGGGSNSNSNSSSSGTSSGVASSSASTPTTPTTSPTPTPTAAPAAAPTAAEASRFLIQATPGPTRKLIADVQSQGYSAWLDKQFAIPAQDSHWDWIAAHKDPSTGKSFLDTSFLYQQNGFDATAWRKLLSSPDPLRQRIVLALSEIIVVSIDGLDGHWPQFRSAGYLDLLEKYAFGNYRELLQAVSKNVAMGQYLTFLGNEKQNAATGSFPDENYARELMQLFTIGLVQLNLDGTPKLVNGAKVETYAQTDITQLARVFTGWTNNLTNIGLTPNNLRPPMIQNAGKHETGASTFLGSTVPAGLDGEASLTAALDIIFAHPNVAPFISRQLIQKLVTSNPIPAYVQRVATVFNNNGKGVKGDLSAVIRAILLDDEARNKANISNPKFGKVREPVLRYTAWARAFNVSSNNGVWDPGWIIAPEAGLGQSPLRSPSVFNFFRPGYVLPNSSISSAGMVSPEMQLCNETSVIGYLNYMTTRVFGHSSYAAYKDTSKLYVNLTVDYSSLLPLASNPAALVKELNLLLAADQLSAATTTKISTALSTMLENKTIPPSDANHYLKNRIYAAIVMVLGAPEFIVIK